LVRRHLAEVNGVAGPSTVIYVNDSRGHAAVLALFDEVIAAG
jgi:hypothetical protein